MDTTPYKKIILPLVIIIAVIAFIVISSMVRNDNVNSGASPSTGKTIDISEKDETVIFADPGDVLFLSLQAPQVENYQWSLKSPLSGSFISVEKHENKISSDSLSGVQDVSEWRFKIEKSAEFEIVFQYENPQTENPPKEIFRLKVISSKPSRETDDILISTPSMDELLEKNVLISGYARTSQGSIGYRLRNDANTSLAQGQIDVPESSEEDWYFERSVSFISQDRATGTLEIFQIRERDGSRIDGPQLNIRLK